MRFIFRFSEYAGNIGDASESEDKEMEKQRIMQLVHKF